MTTNEEFEGAFKSAGVTISGDLMVPQPPPGEHLWVVPVWYRVDESNIDADDELPTLQIRLSDNTMVMAGTVGCIICRFSYDTMRGEPCPGKAVEDQQ